MLRASIVLSVTTIFLMAEGVVRPARPANPAVTSFFRIKRGNKSLHESSSSNSNFSLNTSDATTTTTSTSTTITTTTTTPRPGWYPDPSIKPKHQHRYDRVYPMMCMAGYLLRRDTNVSTLEECKSICNADRSCKALEYYTPHGGAGTTYVPGDCMLKSEAWAPKMGGKKNPCNGQYENLDFHVKGITQLASTVMWTITGTMIVLMVLVQCNEVQRMCVARDVDDADDAPTLAALRLQSAGLANAGYRTGQRTPAERAAESGRLPRPADSVPGPADQTASRGRTAGLNRQHSLPNILHTAARPSIGTNSPQRSGSVALGHIGSDGEEAPPPSYVSLIPSRSGSSNDNLGFKFTSI